MASAIARATAHRWSACPRATRPTPLPGCFFYSYAGANPELDGGMTGKRRGHVAGIALSRQFVPRVLVGMTTKYYDFESNMTGERNARRRDVRPRRHPARDADDEPRRRRLRTCGRSDEYPEFPRTLGGGLHGAPDPVARAEFDMRWKLDGEETSARFGGGIECSCARATTVIRSASARSATTTRRRTTSAAGLASRR